MDPAEKLKRRRQTLIYPSSKNSDRAPKPFSRSAAKRESVLALGSIEHLQHYFTKAGIQAKKKPQSNQLLVSAIGGATSIPRIVETEEPESYEEEITLPPSPNPVAPARPAYPSVDKSYVTDPEVLKPGVIQDLIAVEEAWGIATSPSSPGSNGHLHPNPHHDPEAGVDVLHLLQLTTRAIRSVRNYVVSLPDESTHTTPASLSPAARAKSMYRPSTMQPQPPPRPARSNLRHLAPPGAGGLTPMHTGAAGTSPVMAPGSLPPVPPVPPLPGKETLTPPPTVSALPPPDAGVRESNLAQIRKWALEALHALHALEERARLPLSDEAYDMQSEASDSHSHPDVQGPSSPSAASTGGGHRRSSTSPPALVAAGGSDTTSDPDEQLPDQDAAISLSFSVLTLTLPDNSHRHIRVWSEEDETLLDSHDDPNADKEKWDERIVLGSGWLYRLDMTWEDLEKQKEVVKRYLDVVDGTLFGGFAVGGGERGWKKEKVKPVVPKASTSTSNPTSGKTSPELLRSVSPTITRGGAGGTGLLPSTQPPYNPYSLNSLGNLSSLNTALSSFSEENETESPETAMPKEVELNDEDLPEWAKRKSDLFGDDPHLDLDVVDTPTISTGTGGPTPSGLRPLDSLARAHALLVTLLPAALLYVLPLPLDTDELDSAPTLPGGLKSRIPRGLFLEALSNGQLLCVAYNAGVRKSRKQWGFVNPESVHDVVSMEAASASADAPAASGKGSVGTGWTFRRIDNLRLFIAALKLRYLIPIYTTSEWDKAQAKAKDSPPKKGLTGLVFDAKTVARRESGWESMLEGVVLAWVDAVVKEKRVR